MASSKQYLAIDLGSSTLKIGVFQLDHGGALTLVDYVLRDLGLDPNKEQERFPFIVETLQSVVNEKRLGSLSANCSISGHYAFTRFVKLPPVDPGQIDQMLGFEAQQNVPFPIQEVVWDYQLLGAKEGKDLEAVIVAVKSDLVEQAHAALAASRLSLETVDVSPLALVNAFKFNYEQSNDCVLLIDIGAKSSNLIFLEGKKIYCRAIPIGGHLISQNISNEFQEPYVAAELLKKGKGFVGLGGAYADPEDAAAARISKVARSVFSRLHAEISRSISFYRNQQSGSAPQKIYLSGGSVAMPYADLFFREKLNVPVEFFNPLRNVTVGPAVNRSKLTSDAYLLGEVVGLGLRRMDSVPVEINLIPASVTTLRENKGRTPYLVATVAVWVLMFLLLVGSSFLTLDKISGATGLLQADFDKKSQLAASIARVDKDLATANREAGAVQHLLTQRDSWPELMRVIYDSVSGFKGLWISKLELDYEENGHDISVTVVPHDAAVPQHPVPGRGRAGVVPASQPLNVAPKGTVLNLSGFFEAAENGTSGDFDVLENFRELLGKSGLFQEVKISQQEVVNRQDQIALQFTIRAVLKESKQVDLQP